MLPFYIDISVDDDFGIDDGWGTSLISTHKSVKGIIRWSGNDAVVDPKIFDGKPFFKPVEDVLRNNVRITDLTQESFVELMKPFGEFVIGSNDRNLVFNGDNAYDLMYAYVDNSQKGVGRLCFNFRNCPVSSFYLIDDGGTIKIVLSPFSKNYYTITESEWYSFVNYLERELGIAELREIKLNDILGDKNSHINIVRQLAFIVDKDSRRSNSFLSSVYDHYRKKGFITDRQAQAVAKTIW